MHIPSHQVHNVLKAYKMMIIRKENAGEDQKASDISLFTGKRQAVVEKIIKDIAIRIIRNKKGKISPFPHQHKEAADPPGVFVYNSINFEGSKETRTLELEATDFLIQSIEKLAREEVAIPERKQTERR